MPTGVQSDSMALRMSIHKVRLGLNVVQFVSSKSKSVTSFLHLYQQGDIFSVIKMRSCLDGAIATEAKKEFSHFAHVIYKLHNPV